MGAVSGEEPAADGKEKLRRERERFRKEVAAREARLRRFRRRGDRGFWHGVATFGMVGWSVAVPALLGIALGRWLDARFGGGIRYTLSLLVFGLAVGANNAWRWIQLQQEEALQEEEEGAPGGEDGGR